MLLNWLRPARHIEQCGQLLLGATGQAPASVPHRRTNGTICKLHICASLLGQGLDPCVEIE